MDSFPFSAKSAEDESKNKKDSKKKGKKIMKKLVSIFLAIALLFTFSMSVLAANTNINLVDDTRTYNAYKLFDATSSLKSGHVAHERDCDDDCYNYSYTVANNNPYFDILKGIASSDNLAGVLAYLEDNKGDAQTVADTIYRAIKHLGPDATVTKTTTSLAQGYWLFADVTGNDLDDDEAHSVVLLKTAGLDTLEINPKTATPTIVKQVLEVNDSNNTPGSWQDAADYDIGDDVFFKLTATLPANYASYDAYKLKFMDKLADGFTLKADTIQVAASNTTLDVADYEIKTTNVTTGYDFEVIFANLKDIAGVTAETVFEVTYDATLNVNAEIGEDGNANVVDLVFSNNPYGDGTGKISDRVNVYTYELVVNKVTTVGDDENVPLTGAGFTLYKKDSNGNYNPANITAVKSNDGTTFTFKGLDAGDYKLEESVVPAGYNKSSDVEFTVAATYTEDDLTTLTSGFGTVEETDGVFSGVITGKITNLSGTALPETGAAGTMWLIAGGAALVLLAGVFMITRKKMSVFED